MAEKLFLIDGTAVIYRAFFAFIRNPLINSKGQNTSALYGTVNSFLKLVEKYNVDLVAVSFDRKEKTFRHKITETYKANRPPAPQELIQQVQPIKDFFLKIDLPEISCAGYEADDVLATLAERYKTDHEIIIVTGDKDFSQLVDDRVVLYDPFKEEILDEHGIEKKYGLKPEKFVDYLAICGDTSDNIPGISGIGPKGAVKLLSEFETLENIYKNLDQVKSDNVKKKLLDSKENAFMSQKLARIVRDVPLDLPEIEQMRFSQENLKKAVSLLKDYELNSIVNKISTNYTQSEIVTEPDQELEKVLIKNNKDFDLLNEQLKKADLISLDTETTSENPILAKLVGISICIDKKKAYYISLGHYMSSNADMEHVLTGLKESLTGSLLVAHNLKYDYLVLSRSGWEIEAEFFDTMIADYILNPTSRHSLAACARREFEYEMIPIKELIGTGKKQITFDLVPVEQAADYSADDAWITFKLYELFKERLTEQNLLELYQEIELPLFEVLARMEQNGVYIDTDILKEISKRNQKKIAELTREIYNIAGSQFNLNSTQQLAKVLFEDLGIPPVKKTKTGYSTDVKVLDILSKDHLIARLLMQYRQLTKLESTYVKALPELINPETDRVHSSFNQTVASTGRLSSSNPNLQNIPIRTEMGKEIRNAFTCQSEENMLISADYSQIELRILAILSRDPNLIEAFKNKRDIHTETASIIYEKDRKDVTADERRFAKVINFGLLYGMGAFRISNELKISRREGQEFVDNYFNKFPTIHDFIDDVINSTREKGYAETLFGRKLYLPEINSSNKNTAREAERVATNMPIQGSAADIIKIAMIRIHEKIKERDDLKMIIQVHDELIFEVKKNVLEEAKKIIVTEMESALPDKYAEIISLTVDLGVGKNWFEAH